MSEEENHVASRESQEQETQLLEGTDDNSAFGNNGNNTLVIEEIDAIESDVKRCVKLRQCCHSMCKPFHTKHHPVTETSSCCQKFIYNFMCPPHGTVGSYLQVLLFIGVTFAILIAITKQEGLPGGNFFSLAVLFFAAQIGGYLINFLRLPPLLGMLLVGGLLNNVPTIKTVGESIDITWSQYLRQLALTIILIRAGLGLDPKALKRLSFTVLRLAFSPCLAECIVEAIAAYFLLDFPWVWGFILGFVLAAVSPAVVVPSLLNLSDRGYGLNKGIPTLVIAAASVDDVLAITGHGVAMGIAFSSGSIGLALARGPLEAILGIIYGIVMGILLWYFPTKGTSNPTLWRSLLLCGLGLMATAGSSAIHLSGAGPLGCLTLAFVAAFKWRQDEEIMKSMNEIVGVLWMILQPFLFGLIGAAVSVDKFNDKVGLGIAVLGIGMVVRLVVSFLTVFGANLNFKEMIFVAFAWFPKATVQAAIGGLALDLARSTRPGDLYLEDLGTTVLTMAVLSIIITAPIGAALIAIFGPRFLHRTVKNDSQIEERRSLTEL